MRAVLFLYPSWEDTQTLSEAGGISPANILRCAAVLALSYLAFRAGKRFDDRRSRIFLHGTVLSLWLYVFCFYVPEISRICYYLMFSQIFLIPELVYSLPEKGRRRAAAGAVLLSAAFFAGFLRKADDPRIRILPYKTFLFHELTENPSRSVQERYQ